MTAKILVLLARTKVKKPIVGDSHQLCVRPLYDILISGSKLFTEVNNWHCRDTLRRLQWLCCPRRGSAAATLTGTAISNPAGETRMSLPCDCCVFSV